MQNSPAILPPSGEIPKCCGNDAPHTPVAAAATTVVVTTRFHFSLNVSDLERSTAFYAKLFGVPPAKHYPDYAKFELDQPPLVFSLVPNPPATVGSLSHLGFPVDSLEEVEATARRLIDAGLNVSCQQGTTCGYAQQDKIWVSDPDHNYWEIYVVHVDVDPAEVRRAFDGVAPTTAPASEAAPPPVRWEHRVAEETPVRIPYDNDEVDEVRLTGTFNASLSRDERHSLLAEARRVLKPGGLLSVHGLVASEDLNGKSPTLPGVAALVKRVPVESEPVEELRAAGFVGVYITKLPQQAVFEYGSVEMREVKVSARTPSVASGTGERRRVVYKGPFAATEDETGMTFARGRRTEVTDQQWNDLARSPAAIHFLFLDENSNSACPE